MFDKLFLSVSWWGAARDIVALSIFILFIFVCSLSAEVQSHIGLVRDYASSTAPWDSLSSLRCGGRSLGVVRGEILRIFSQKFCRKTNKGDLKIESRGKREHRGRLGFCRLVGLLRRVHAHFVFPEHLYRGWKKIRRGREDGGRADDTLAHQRELCSTRAAATLLLCI